MSDPNSLAAGTLVCDVSIDDPHFSDGPRAVISKLRYTCAGTLQGELKVDLSIYRYPPGTVGPYAPKATNYDTRNVFGGASGTVYIPAQGQGGIFCKMTDWYYAYADVTMIAGLQADYGDARSNTVHPKRCS